MCLPLLKAACEDGTYELIRLQDYPLPPFSNDRKAMEATENYQILHGLVSTSDALVLASPVYNWGCCAELKKFIEYTGSTSGPLKGAFYDKIITFINAAGVPHSYMAFTSLATSMMLDFKCIINPYNVYVHNRHWEAADNTDSNSTGDTLSVEACARLKKSLEVTVELAQLLSARKYSSEWEI